MYAYNLEFPIFLLIVREKIINQFCVKIEVSSKRLKN